jgi:hypothetical protein
MPGTFQTRTGGTFGREYARVPDEPGAEMQHDTSPYTLSIGGQKMNVIGSLIYLRYSKMRYLKFYRSFNRFQMKCFFHAALNFWGVCAPVCIIDNTNLARLRRTGKNAVMTPDDYGRLKVPITAEQNYPWEIQPRKEINSDLLIRAISRRD